MATLLDVVIPGLPPSTNRLWRSSGHRGRPVYMAPEARRWKEAAVAVMAFAKGKTPPYSGPVSFSLEIMSKSRRKWDLDNRIKAVQDALQAAAVIVDDSQIQEIRARRVKGDRDETRIRLLEASDDDTSII